MDSAPRSRSRNPIRALQVLLDARAQRLLAPNPAAAPLCVPITIPRAKTAAERARLLFAQQQHDSYVQTGGLNKPVGVSRTKSSAPPVAHPPEISALEIPDTILHRPQEETKTKPHSNQASLTQIKTKPILELPKKRKYLPSVAFPWKLTMIQQSQGSLLHTFPLSLCQHTRREAQATNGGNCAPTPPESFEARNGDLRPTAGRSDRETNSCSIGTGTAFLLCQVWNIESLQAR